ncbi:MAG: cell division protein SepF [Actinomycetota bacterium]
MSFLRALRAYIGLGPDEEIEDRYLYELNSRRRQLALDEIEDVGDPERSHRLDRRSIDLRDDLDDAFDDDDDVDDTDDVVIVTPGRARSGARAPRHQRPSGRITIDLVDGDAVDDPDANGGTERNGHGWPRSRELDLDWGGDSPFDADPELALGGDDDQGLGAGVFSEARGLDETDPWGDDWIGQGGAGAGSDVAHAVERNGDEDAAMRRGRQRPPQGEGPVDAPPPKDTAPAAEQPPPPTPSVEDDDVVRSLDRMRAKPRTLIPESFADAKLVADEFKRGIPVLLNLQGLERDLARRLIDFASGICYALDGSMEKIASQVFLLIPDGAEVSDEDRRRIEERGYAR